MAHAQPIEVAGETNPLNYQNLVNALSLAASSDWQQIKASSAQLNNWQKQTTFYSMVQDVFCDQSLPQDVRHMAITQLKNAAGQFWRKTAPNALPKDQKDKIKVTALQAGVLEPVSVLAVQNALLVAKIVRQEYPQDWPDAISSVITLLRTAIEPGANPFQLPGTLKILLEVTKGLSEARILRIQESFRSVAPEILRVLGNIYVDKVNQWVAALEQGIMDESLLLDTIQHSLLSLRILRRLIVGGFARPGYNQDVQEFWAVTCSHLVKFVSIANESAKLPGNLSIAIEKHILQLTKLHANMSTRHPASFALFTQTIDLLKTYWAMLLRLSEVYVSLGQGNDEEEGSTWPEKTGLRTLNLIRSCVKLAFKPVQTFRTLTQEDKDDRKVAVARIKELFTDNFVLEAMEVLVTKFFRFRDSDSVQWEYQAEEWEMGEENDGAYEFSIHFCSQKLFQDLVIHFPSLLIPRLLDVFHTFARLDNQDVILKDCVYSAIGLAAPSLAQRLNFNAFLESTLIPEVQIEKPEYRLLRRRIAIVLSSWVPIKPDDLNTSAVYQIFQHLLNKDDSFNHQVVRLTAGRHLCHVIDPYEFAPEQLSPFAASIIGSLMLLIQETQLPETKLAMLETLRVVVLKMEHNIAPYSDQVISFLPTLWDESVDEILLRQGILNLMAALIHSLKENSARYHSLLLPLVKTSLDPNSPTFEDFVFDTLELWSALAMQSPSPASPELLAGLPAVIPIIERGAECTPVAIQVVESYVLLAPKEILGDEIRLPLLRALGETLTFKSEVNPGAVTRIVQKMIRGAETIDGGSEAIYGIISKSLIDSGFLRSILQGLYSAHQASQTTGPNRKKSEISGIVEGHYFSVLARLALANPSIFAAAVAAATESTEEQTLDWILSEWFFHFDSVGSISERKLHALGLTQLFNLRGPSNGPPNFILNRLQSYLTVWTDIIVELAEGCTGHPSADYLVHWDSSDPETAVAQNVETIVTPQNARETEWSNSDPVHCLPMRDFVRERLSQAIIACGGAQRFQEEWLVNVDAEVSAAFGALGLI
ncbi:hypothetical protein N7495_005795 [Penicillium taxi]|uniref:uncharacterized protein n=1 Tax=Penicillium taxi TaxID=168475 RepID=UPI002545880F|nr:uncharacterized protein N7495_005795 [Penicillium taxi]KAJ5894104.1 hypothetical protein N7495_005795 [Penicillium taxi]